MIHRVAPFLLAVMLAACGETGNPQIPGEGAAQDNGSAEEAQPEEAEATPAAGARSVSEENDVWVFEYSYPEAAGRIPGLAMLLDDRLSKSQDELKELAMSARADADSNGFPFNPYSETTEWKVVTDLPRWLSLSAQIYSYTGGAHGNHGFDSLVWDREADTDREPKDLFVSLEALEGAMREDYCRILDRQRAEKRGSEPLDADSPFSECPPFSDLTIILGSSNNRSFDRIGFFAAPYVAGPYAEGSYEVTLPVTRAAKDAVKPEFAAAFTATR